LTAASAPMRHQVRTVSMVTPAWVAARAVSMSFSESLTEWAGADPLPHDIHSTP
jgi:hypothetical protein